MIDQILAVLRTRAALIIDESAQPSAAYDFQRFDAANAQAGISGSVVSSQGGRHLEYSLNDNGRVSTSSEDVQDPVVTGPSVHGFIRHHEIATPDGRFSWGNVLLQPTVAHGSPEYR